MTREFSLMQGNVALVEGALYGGCRFYAGYPITPSTEITEECSARLPRVGGRFIQMEDEIASLAAIIGASLAGVKAMTATSGPGFSLMQEQIGYACMAEIPIVIVNIMRGGPSTGLPTSPGQGDILQSRWGTHGDHPIVVLSPANVEEMFTETIRAFNIAEMVRNPVIILADEVIGHMRERIAIPDEGQIPTTDRVLAPINDEETLRDDMFDQNVPPMKRLGDGHRFHTTGLTHDNRGFPTQNPKVADDLIRRLHRKIEEYRDGIEEVDESDINDAEAIVICLGSVTRSAEAAIHQLQEEGIRVGLFRPVTLFPFPRKRLRRVLKTGVKAVVAEMSLGQLMRLVESASEDRRQLFSLCKVDGDVIAPEEIVNAVKRALDHDTDK